MRWLLAFCVLMGSAQAGFVEFSANFWQNRQVYGANQDSSTLSQTYALGWAWYLWRYTALEFTGQRQRNLVTENDPVDLSATEQIVSSRNEVITNTYSVGIKQSLAPQKSRIIPAITAGYAKQYVSGQTRYVVDDAGSVEKFTVEDEDNIQDSCFAGASLRLRVTEFFGLMGSFRSIMEGCDTAKFSDNTQVTAGLSWIF